MNLIAITPSAIESRHVLNRAYTEAFVRADCCPVILPQFAIENRELIDQEAFEALHRDRLDELAAKMSAIVLSGGPDLSPPMFGEVNYASYNCNSERDMMEVALLKAFLAANKPILGICRGFQCAARFLGLGHFQQEISVTGEAHSGGSEPYSFKDRQEPMHMTEVFGAFRDYLREKTHRENLDSIRQNSLHHQGCTIPANGKRPVFRGQKEMNQEQYDNLFARWRAESISEYEQAHDVRIIAATPLVIEAFEREGSQLVCYQNHVEESGPNGLAIQYFLDRYVL